MRESLPRGMDVTLYATAQENGLFFNVIASDFSKKHVEHLFWRTSYPHLDFLYPQWWKKKDIVLADDFWWESLKMAEKLFKWDIIDSHKLFLLPNEGFGKGISGVYGTFYPHAKIRQPLATQKGVILQSTATHDIESSGLQLTQHFNEKLVIIVLNFLSVDIYEYTPKSIGNARKWDSKVTKVSFDSPMEFLDRIVSKRFMSFLSSDLPQEHVFNSVMNYLYWKPAVTSSDQARDMVRAVYTEMIAELVAYTGISNAKRGHLIVTGEVPSFMADKAYTELLCIDGLGISGVWSMYVDTYALLLPMLLRSQHEEMPLPMIIPSSDVMVIPTQLSERDIVKAVVDKKEYLATSGNIYRYKIESYVQKAEISLPKEQVTFSLPTGVKFKSLVVDARKWPVVYGPTPASNASRVPAWLQRLKMSL